VLCFGDSLTAGYWENGRRFHPYASEATRLLGVKIDHVGLCGYTRCRCARCDGAVNAPAATTGAAAARRKAAGVRCRLLLFLRRLCPEYPRAWIRPL
jgi:hypothetical protein